MSLPDYAGDLAESGRAADRCVARANSVEQAASTVSRTAAELTRAGGGWSGSASDAFLASVERSAVPLRQVSRALDEASAVLRRLAGQLQHAESVRQQALELAQTAGMHFDALGGVPVPALSQLPDPGQLPHLTASAVRAEQLALEAKRLAEQAAGDAARDLDRIRASLGHPASRSKPPQWPFRRRAPLPSGIPDWAGPSDPILIPGEVPGRVGPGLALEPDRGPVAAKGGTAEGGQDRSGVSPGAGAAIIAAIAAAEAILRSPGGSLPSDLFDRGSNVTPARKADLGSVDGVARKYGIKNRKRFGKWIETEKKYDAGSGNDRGDYTPDELERKAQEYKQENPDG